MDGTSVPTSTRNTPTSVGKTGCGYGAPPCKEKHPHERGEDEALQHSRCEIAETPPRAWGRRAVCKTSENWIGNTPTSVGKTASAYGSRHAAWKHPHERGEDPMPRASCILSRETPPRAWGRPWPDRQCCAPVGNTPTSVGKTASDPALPARTRKHPHERGEDASFSANTSFREETPPRAWGRLGLMASIFVISGNTPTSVGKTCRSHIHPPRWEKHPHERGEDACHGRCPRSIRETPPRAWGRRGRDLTIGDDHRNTPTSVGKTFST